MTAVSLSVPRQSQTNTGNHGPSAPASPSETAPGSLINEALLGVGGRGPSPRRWCGHTGALWAFAVTGVTVQRDREAVRSQRRGALRQTPTGPHTVLGHLHGIAVDWSGEATGAFRGRPCGNFLTRLVLAAGRRALGRSGLWAWKESCAGDGLLAHRVRLADSCVLSTCQPLSATIG